jgi:hypothetical protein
LDDVTQTFNVARERVRQIETNSFEAVRLVSLRDHEGRPPFPTAPLADDARDIPAEELTGDDGTAILVFHRDANFPASRTQEQLTLFVRATKPGEKDGELGGRLDTAARRGSFLGLALLPIHLRDGRR